MLIAFEGPDRVGKSTQCALLARHLREKKLDVEVFSFPRRGTRVGQLLAEHLGNELVLPARAAHLLFSANRWELEDDISEIIDAGGIVILDRYVASGTAYSVAQGLPRAWCVAADDGLRVPNRTILLHADDRLSDRPGFGQERYENQALQDRVIREFDSMQTASWKVVDADGSMTEVHARVLDAVADLFP